MADLDTQSQAKGECSAAVHSESVLPFLFRLRPVVNNSVEQRAAVCESQTSKSLGVARKQIAGQLPFFLRLWWLRDCVGSERFPSFANEMITCPLGSQYSDPLCDAGSADMTISL